MEVCELPCYSFVNRGWRGAVLNFTFREWVIEGATQPSEIRHQTGIYTAGWRAWKKASLQPIDHATNSYRDARTAMDINDTMFGTLLTEHQAGELRQSNLPADPSNYWSFSFLLIIIKFCTFFFVAFLTGIQSWLKWCVQPLLQHLVRARTRCHCWR